MKKKTDEREWTEAFLTELPEEASEAVVRYAKEIEAINPPVIIYGRESVPEPDSSWLMTPYGWEGETRYHWGARCKCTACGETFETGYRDKKIVVLQMEDGNILEGWTDGEDIYAAHYGEGQYMDCPRCGESCRVIRRSSIKSGRRMYTTQIIELTNIGSTTALLYWLASYRLERDGYHWVGIWPRAAIAISPSGSLKRFSHTAYLMDAEYMECRWKEIKSLRDPELIAFNEGGSSMRSTIGGYYISTAGDMQGTTGEKTGIKAYFAYPDAVRAASYLMIWKKYPGIENITNTGGVRIAAEIAAACGKQEYYGYRATFQFHIPDLRINLRETKPNRILGVTKPEYRHIIGNPKWTLEAVEMFLEYKGMFPETAAEDFTGWLELPGRESLRKLKPYWKEGIGKLYRYLCRQERDHSIGVIDSYYVDYRIMLERVRNAANVTAELTPEEIFPAHLVRAHERVDDAVKAIQRESKRRGGTDAQFRTFAELKEKHAALEWKRGEYCIIIPKSPEELVAEGETLHHCVGGYASQHCRGQMIFFVRHSRRPERSWFTLNENINGENVNRIQLHGYKNELVSGKRLTIPQEVEEFVQNWETNILAPYLKNNNRRKQA